MRKAVYDIWWVEPSPEEEVAIDTKYNFGHIIYKDKKAYVLTGLGGSKIHSFKEIGAARVSVLLVREKEIPRLETKPNRENLKKYITLFEDGRAEIIRADGTKIELFISTEEKREKEAFWNWAVENEALLPSDRMVSLLEKEVLSDKIPLKWRT